MMDLLSAIPTFEVLLHPETPEAQDIFRRAEEENQAQLNRQLWNNYLKCGAHRKDLNEAGFDHFKQVNGNKHQKELMELCQEYIRKVVSEPDFNRILCLYGKSGYGKTYYALSCLKLLCLYERPHLTFTRHFQKFDAEGNRLENQFDDVVEDANIRAFYSGSYVTSEELCEFMDGNFKTPEQRGNNRASVNYYKKTALLVIDEVGRTNNDKKERDALFSVINFRLSNYKPTIICTNLNEDEMQNILGNALWSRIQGNAKMWSVDGMENMRKPSVQKELQEQRHEAGRR